jgi:aminoglycoside phosphotransferase (APT) family kinase protein
MAAQLPELTPPLTFTLIAGGRSNLTFRVEDAGGRAWALRRPPLHHVLPTAHDMSREYRCIDALGPAGIPVPMTVGLCTDESVNERPFYVMEFVDGHILRSAPEAEKAFDPATRRAVGVHMADTLAGLHAVDPDAVGLGDLGLLMVYWADPDDGGAVLGIAATTAPGFATRAQVMDRYAAASGLDLSELGFYTAFGYWKLACILQGVYARYVAGAGAGDTGSVDAFPAQVAHLAEMAAASLESVA